MRRTEKPDGARAVCLSAVLEVVFRGCEVSGINEPHDTDFEEANSQLVAGLKSCRSVVENYRAMLTPEQAAPNTDGAIGDADSGESFAYLNLRL